VELRQGSLESMELTPAFWCGKRVLVTGHTGFKGSWLSLWLQSLGADLLGYALPAPTDPSIYALAGVGRGMRAVCADILDLEPLRRAMFEFQPQIVFHLAAQSLVRRSYADPIGTFSTNVLGTANVLECVRSTPTVQATVIVTTDKCYENRCSQNQSSHNKSDSCHNHEPQPPFRETDRLGGFDPYSSSKAAAELVAAAFRQCFFSPAENISKPGIATARAGNVVGGGDWAADRLVADVMRAAIGGGEVLIRNPHAIRPWQHVLDPLCGYLMLAEKLSAEPARFSEAWNFGPDEAGAVSVSEVLHRLQNYWGPGVFWRVGGGDHPHEAACLTLDCTKARTQLEWTPHWNLNVALEATVRWYKAYQAHQDVRRLTQEQIQSFQNTMTPSAISQR
jgi:CDP-glucose 4,6-dehydratase